MKYQSNADIRKASKAAGVPLWMVADALKVCDMTLTRRLRHELPQAEKDKIIAIIENLAAERDAETA